MFVFELPEIGEGVVEGEIVSWKIAAGEMVAIDQPICEIMTDKATVEISSPKSGRVLKLHGVPGDVVKVHSALMELDLAGGGAAVAPVVTLPVAAAPTAPAARPVATTAAQPPERPHPAVAARMPPPPRAAGERALASPAVRHEASARGLDVDRVPGSGKGGRVTRDDLASFNQGAVPIAPAALAAPAVTQGDQRVRIIGLRRKISEKMVHAWQTAPHFTYVDEIDASRLVDLRKSLAPLAEARGVKLSYLPFVMKALVLVFREFPTLNAVMDEANFDLIVRGNVNIGIATDTPAGLFVPVIKDVQAKPLLQLAAEIADVTQRTREGKARLDELGGGTFTITSVGNIGGRFATPILNTPEVAILGLNQIHDRPVAVDGQVVIRPMMYLSPSFDHRVIDGAVAARAVSALKAILENPARLFADIL
ncbi:MAG: 2-oxo acid dehydrogenase subunit E2 [Myxococcales bacterium]|nr:2-oxo acid dehydrogenase subunit E2 [Myxococcales bacterium]